MPSIFYYLIFFLFANFLIEPTTCALPAYFQNLELDDITSLWDKFPSIIGQIKQAVNRFRCPKGWRRLGGSCYYLSNITSIPSEANDTCNLLHSNHSNLMQIRNTVELFYAAHVLTKNNLSGLMIDIDTNLLKGKKIAELLMDDQGRWQRMKNKFREVRVSYYKLKEKVLDELNAAGLRISRRSKKIKQSVKKRKQKLIEDRIDYDTDDYDNERNITDADVSNDTAEVVEYEYDNLDSEDEGDEFEQIDDIRGICDQIDWNVMNNNETIYLLTTYIIADKIVCSLSNVESDTEYEHVCEYVLDFCFANIICGKHGHCVNTLSGFKCSCSFLYGGILCEKISKQGKQILFGIVIIAILYGLSFRPVRWLLIKVSRKLIKFCKNRRRISKYKKKKKKQNASKEDKEKLVEIKKPEEDPATAQKHQIFLIPRRSMAQEIMEFIREICQCITLPTNYDPVNNPNKRDLIRLCWVGGLTVFFLALLLSITTKTHFTSFKYDIVNEAKLDALVNETIHLVAKCGSISNYRTENLVFFPISVTLILIFSWSIKREKRCLLLFDGRPGLIAPIEPFRTTNRFTTATVFGILAFEILKIFEELLFKTVDPLNRGILIELLERVAIVLLIGLRYYPVLASLQLRNISIRLIICLYVGCDIAYTIVREGSCMGFLPLSTYYSALEEAKLRMELGTWFIIYGLIKNTPHFILLSYIAAELFVRFAYDSIYVPIKKKQSIWLSPVAQPDEAAFAKYYVTKLFRRNLRSTRPVYSDDTDIDNIQDQMQDHEYEAELQKEENQSRTKKFLSSIYKWDDDFRFTTMATCTYAVAIVFLYYLACTLAFLYISRTTGHISFIRYYIEATFNIEFHGFFSLRSIIIISAVITVMIFSFQLFIGMQNYKKHKLQLFKGIYVDVPSAANFKPNAIAAKSVHYSGFLVGYMAWGFIIVFHLIFFILSAIRIMSLQVRYIEVLLAVTVPVTVVYLLKMTSTSSAGKFLFIHDAEEKLNLTNRKIYAIFIYFNFFADCFLGIASCIIRLIKATFLNVVYMARLDCSFLGRPLEKFDLGFAAYVSYLHMEVTHTNPIMLAFCYSLYEDVVKRRPKQCYDDECCIAPGEMNDDTVVIEPKPKVIEKVSSKSSDRDSNGSSSKKTKAQARATVSPITKKQNSPDTDDDDDGGLSVKEIKPKTKSQSPSIISEKGSQKSKQQKRSIDNNTEEEKHDDDGGPPTTVTSTIARLIPHEPPRLPPPSAPIPEAPIRQDLPPEEDEYDDDGGIKPPSVSTVVKIIPSQPPRLLPVQRSSPPPTLPVQHSSPSGILPVQRSSPSGIVPVQRSSPSGVLPVQRPSPSGTLPVQSLSPPRIPQRQDIATDEDYEDDDGGINPKVIAKKKEEMEKKKKKKEETKKKKPLDDDEDDDGGISKSKQNTDNKKKTTTTKPTAPIMLDDEDEDGGVSKQKLLAAQKKKQALDAKKKKKEQIKAIANQDNDEDDDGAPTRQEPIKKKQPVKTISKSEMLKEEDEDDDGGRIPKTYNTVKMIMPSKPPVLDNKTKKLPSPEATDDGSMLTSGPQQRQPLLASYDTVGRMVPKISTDYRKTTEGSHYDTIPTDEERAARGHTNYSPPSYGQVGNLNDLYPLRTISYREATQHTPPLPQRQPTSTPSIRSHSNTNEDSSHYSEITTDTASSGVINRSYSNTGSIKSSSNHSIKQQNKQSSQYTLKEQNTEESTVETDQEGEEEEEEGEEEEEKEEEDEEEKEQPKIKPLQGKPKPIPIISTAYPKLSYLVNPEIARELERITKRKQARFRWFLAYTIINNYHLFDLRKQVQSRLARLHIERSNPIDEQQHAAAVAVAAAAAAEAQQPAANTEIPESSTIKQRNIKTTTLTPEIPMASAQQPALPIRLLSVPVPVVNDYSQSPAERYVAIRSSMLYDVTAQQSDTPRSPVTSQVTSAIGQQPPFQTKSNLHTRNLRFQQPPNVVIQPPSDSSNISKGKRPAYERQETVRSTPSTVVPLNGTPIFHGIPGSNQSTADYPLANGSSITNFSTLRTQMSHAQHMQAWRRDQLKKIQKKNSHSYVYGSTLRRPLEEKVANAAILTPQLLSPGDNLQRLPSNLPFQYPPQQIKTINEKPSKTPEKQLNTTSSSNIDEDTQSKLIKKKTLRTTSVEVHRKDSRGSSSHATDV